LRRSQKSAAPEKHFPVWNYWVPIGDSEKGESG